MPEKFITSAALSKLIGGFGGNLIAQSILKPNTMQDFFKRSFSSILLAYYLTGPIINWFTLPKDRETEMAVALGIGLFGWFLVSLILNTIGSAKTVKELKENIK